MSQTIRFPDNSHIDNSLSEIEIDFDNKIKNRLIAVLDEVEKNSDFGDK